MPDLTGVIIVIVDNDIPADHPDHQLCRRVMVLDRLCDRRDSRNYRQFAEKLEKDVRTINDQKTRDCLWSCVRRLRVSTNDVLE